MSGAAADDRGLTLIELIVTVALLALVLAGVSGVFIAGIGAQRDVSSTTSASAQAQVVTRSIVQGIRNSSWFTAESATAAGQLVRARVAAVDATGTATWRCVAWFWSAGDSALYTDSSTAGPVAAPAAADPAGWTLLADDVRLPAGTSAPFTASSNQLRVELLVAEDEGSAARISTTAASRPQNSTGGATC
ncbi:PilW family protein [Naasia sp. SYSU D00948]|uniref:PilW family protein n=1 Tax=Naasia sp. SYSU D00948 TaxID=2817379 RepID=UPI001B30B4CE|nr:prepilin-type N-terminal cleavage/methylation domain-containing protein [Naasia sp. SYSU D00948]